MENKTLGQFITEMRKSKKLTQKQLGDILSVSDKTVSHWERDETSPDISLLLKLSEVFEITADELLKHEQSADFDSSDAVIPPQSEKNMKEEKNKKESIARRFKRYFFLSFLGTAFSLYSLIYTIYFISVFSSMLTDIFAASFMPILSNFKYVAVAILVSVALRIMFSQLFVPDHNTENDEKLYIFKANRIFILNIYLILSAFLLCLSPIALSSLLTFWIFAVPTVVTVIIVIVAEIILRRKGFLKNKKAV